MTNEDGTIWTIFNGEIYNHRELRRDLQLRGHIFNGRSDTEVLPHLYEEYGPEFIHKLRGMFAFAIYDTREQKLLLVRDRFGIKPLFYTHAPRCLAFASEIRALLQLPQVGYEPDRQAVYDFARLLFIPAPETFYKNIRAVRPGEIVEAHFDGNEVFSRGRLYHTWRIAPDDSLTLATAVEKADTLISAAVKQQLESDVPLGALTSGGIDSSLVSASAQAALGTGLRTFNVRFADSQYDETWAALAVAKHIGSHHETLDMTAALGSWSDITGVLRHSGQPFADTSIFACNAVCRLMREKVTVALSGDGGDEGFGGYNFYWWITAISRWLKFPSVFLRGAAVGSAPLARLGALPTTLPDRMRELAGADDTSIIENFFCWTNEREHRFLCRDTNLLPLRRLFEPHWEHHPPAGASRLEKLSMLATEANVRLVLPNDYLFKVDMASMKESMEIRVPMLDEDLFDFTLSLPHSLKVNGRNCKTVLRTIARRKLPQPVAMKPKRGFEMPIDTWLSEDCKASVKNALLGPSTKLAEFFRPAAYEPMVHAFCDGRPAPGISRQGLYERIIMLLSTNLALDQNGNA
jgi:asparagine synthase (glutamine-hydrolysing)